MDHGPAGTDVAESLLSSSGLVDTSNIDPKRLSALIEGMKTAPADQASKMAAQLYKSSDSQAVSQTQSYKNAADAMQSLTTWGQRASYMFENMTTVLFNSNAPGGGKPPPFVSVKPNAPGADPFNGQGPWAQAAARAHTLQQTDPTRFMGNQAINNERINQYAGSGIKVNGATISAPLFQDAMRAANGNPEMMSILLSQMQRESTNSKTGMVDPSLISADGGRGLGQWTDPNVSRKYLGPNWRQAALDPAASLAGMAKYDADLLRGTGGNVPAALAQYNGGPHPNAQAQAYGQSVYHTAEDISGKIDVNVNVNDTRTTVTATPRVVMGAKTHGPPHPDPRRSLHR